jgi:hypothetical protein
MKVKYCSINDTPLLELDTLVIVMNRLTISARPETLSPSIVGLCNAETKMMIALVLSHYIQKDLLVSSVHEMVFA